MKRLIIAMLLIATVTLSGCIDTGHGTRIGNIVKLADQGLLCQTHEGEIIKGGMSAGSGSFGHPFFFTIEDQAIVDVLQKAMDEGKEVKLYYHSEFVTFCRSDSNGDFVYKVEVLN